MTNDDEQLIAEALRAKAGNSVPPVEQPKAGPVTTSVHQTTQRGPSPDPLHQAASMAAAMAPTAQPAPQPQPAPPHHVRQHPAPQAANQTPQWVPTAPGPYAGSGPPIPAQATAPVAEQEEDEPDGPVAAWWIVLIAVILGLALGGMVGILTVL